MSVFADITLSWGDTEHVIAAKRVMGAIARVEDVLTIRELYEASAGGKIKFTKIAAAYGEALRYAGAEVTNDDVYLAMFQGEKSQATILEAINGLLTMMIPPSAMKEAAEAKPGKEPRRAKKAVAPSSRKPTNSSVG